MLLLEMFCADYCCLYWSQPGRLQRQCTVLYSKLRLWLWTCFV